MSGWTGKQNSSVVLVMKSIQSKKVIMLCCSSASRGSKIKDRNVLLISSMSMNDIKIKNELWI